jgi:starvation-inducible DNA-binding protein
MTNIGLHENIRKQIADALNLLLANEYVLYTKTLKHHWNVEGKHFGPLHALFKEHYEALFIVIDDVAERARALGFMADGTLKEFLQKATIKEEPAANPNEQSMIKSLLDGHEEIILQLRNYIDLTVELGDAGTNNFLADLIEKHEKIAWMLRAHLVE